MKQCLHVLSLSNKLWIQIKYLIIIIIIISFLCRRLRKLFFITTSNVHPNYAIAMETHHLSESRAQNPADFRGKTLLVHRTHLDLPRVQCTALVVWSWQCLMKISLTSKHCSINWACWVLSDDKVPSEILSLKLSSCKIKLNSATHNHSDFSPICAVFVKYYAVLPPQAGL